MRRRLDIAASIVITPDVLFLDEPTAGLDPRSRRQVWDIVRTLLKAGTTILLTTQYLEEADQLAERVVIIDHGTVIADGSISELKASVGSAALHVRLSNPQQRPVAQSIVSQVLGVPVHLEADPAAFSVQTSNHEGVAQTLVQLHQNEIAVATFSLGQPSLDEVFLALTGQPLQDDLNPQEEINDER
jgi:ABC-2 type transport system ATP-binding protein